jgi:hypothetical protein
LNIEKLEWSEPETEGPRPACRNNHTTAVVGDNIYFHGGHDGNDWLDDLYILNTKLQWTKPKISGNVSLKLPNRNQVEGLAIQ